MFGSYVFCLNMLVLSGMSRQAFSSKYSGAEARVGLGVPEGASAKVNISEYLELGFRMKGERLPLKLFNLL